MEGIYNKTNIVYSKEKKILFLLLPFWTPLIPPLGISCLKSHLNKYGYNNVKIFDLNTNEQIKEIYDKYSSTLNQYIPENKRGNYVNLVNRVLRRHLLININKNESEDKYEDLLKQIIEKTFYHIIDDIECKQLDSIIIEYYSILDAIVNSIINKEEVNFVGLSTYQGTLASSMYTAKLIKELNSNITIFMGGGIFSNELKADSPNMNTFLTKMEPYIDKIFIGEGETLILEYLKGNLADDQKIYHINDLKKETLDLSTATIPDFSDFSLHNYTMLASYTSRSCPFECSFCSETIYWGKYRKKSAEQIVDELRKISTRYNKKIFLMGDSLLNPVITDFANEMQKQKLSLYWDGYLRTDKHACDINNTTIWRNGGFYRARLGVESGSSNVLKLMDKKITIDQIKQSLKCLSEAGIKTTTYWVIGHPGETEEDFQQTLDLIEECKDYIWEAECNPFEYFYSGQSSSDEWAVKREPLYKEEFNDMLILQSWTLNCTPTREEIYKRVNRFVKHCSKLEIPNPYTLYEIYNADKRWKKLHRNAVPSLVELYSIK